MWPAPSTLALPLLTCYSPAPATQVSFSLLPWALCSHWSLCLENSSLWILASLSTCEKGQINSTSLPFLISLMLYFSFFQNTPHSFNPWFASSYLLCISLHHNPSHTSTGSFVLFLQLLRIVHSRHKINNCQMNYIEVGTATQRSLSESLFLKIVLCCHKTRREESLLYKGKDRGCYLSDEGANAFMVNY